MIRRIAVKREACVGETATLCCASNARPSFLNRRSRGGQGSQARVPPRRTGRARPSPLFARIARRGGAEDAARHTGPGCIAGDYGAAYTYGGGSSGVPQQVFFTNNLGAGLFEVTGPPGGIVVPATCWNIEARLRELAFAAPFCCGRRRPRRRGNQLLTVPIPRLMSAHRSSRTRNCPT